MTDPAPNLPLLRRVLHQIDTYPETWAWGAWAIERRPGDAVETACHVAGWAVVLSGGRPAWNGDPLTAGSTGQRLAAYATMPNGRFVRIETAGRDLLGLTELEAMQLFDAAGRRQVQVIAEDIAARAGELLGDL